MARQQVISYTVVCDLCGEEVLSDDVDNAKHRISWQGKEYTIELCPTHTESLNEAGDRLKVFVAAARPVSTRAARAQGSRRGRSRPASSPSAAPKSDAAAARVWARENGYQVGSRGRIAPEILAAYNEAQSTGESSSATKKRSRRKPAAA